MTNRQGNNDFGCPPNGGRSHVSRPKWPELIKQKRHELGETQGEFGARFGVTYAAVSEWERAISEPPANVTWWIMQNLPTTEATK